jgi:hypothetical protein
VRQAALANYSSEEKMRILVAAAAIALAAGAAHATCLDTPPATDVAGSPGSIGYIMRDPARACPAGAVISKIRIASTSSSDGRVLIERDDGSGVYTPVVDQAFGTTAPSGGYIEITLSGAYTIPSDGKSYYVAGYAPSGTGYKTGQQRAYYIGAPPASSASWGQDTSGILVSYAIGTGGGGGGGDPPPSGSACLIGVAGQSLAAKYNGPTLYTPRNASRLKMLNVQTGVLAAAVDPVGIDGSDGTSFVLPLADMIADAFPTRCATVVVADFGIGGASAAQWAPGGGACGTTTIVCSTLWAALASAAASNGLAVTAILWSQGPQDAANDAMTRASYRTSMTAVIGAIRSAGMSAASVPVFLETQTVANTPSFARREVAIAIAGLVDPAQNILEGPNTDDLDCSYRRSGCVHGNDVGVRAWAYRWAVPLYRYLATH